MNTSILIDTSYIISLLNTRDTKHTKAQDLIPELLSYREAYITNYIYSEIATILAQRLGKQEALALLEKIKERTSNIHITKELDKDVRKKFTQIKNKDVSYIDTSILVVAKKKGIKTILTFDKNLKKLTKEEKLQVLE